MPVSLGRDGAVSRKTLKQLVRYGIVGTATNLGGYGVFCLLVFLGVESKLAMTILYVGFTVAGFFLNKNWSFSSKESNLGPMVRYLLVYGAGYVVNYLILWYLVDHLGFPHYLGQGIGVIVVAGFIFIALRILVFPTAKQKAD